jgi:hypothetical protein
MFRITRRPDAATHEDDGEHVTYGEVAALPGAYEF